MKQFFVSVKRWSFKKLRNVLFSIQIRIQRVVWLLEKKIGIKKESLYVPLTPTTDCDKRNTYSDALSWALDQDNITNIAITGSYGSGKSSVIQKFQKQNPHLKYINISLACFKEKEPSHYYHYPNKDNIELSILQQISYFVKNKKVKDSRISRIKKMTGLNLSLLSFFYGVGLILVLSLFFRNSGIIRELEQYIKKDWFNNKVPEFFYVIIVTYLLVLIFCLMRKLVRYFANISLAKIKLHGGEIELDKSQTPSILNQHLDEILYFFEANKTDIVIIEDLDRYELVEIFSKLREINHLINKSKQINYKTVFIYAVKDDILKEHNFERTKFFDFIIPVVPVINTSNSVDKLLERLNASSVQGIDDRLLKDIALYISDMRLLNNIVNEFLVYKANLQPGLKEEKMLAMILYKNLMPSDFVDILQNKGIVCGIFHRKEELIKSKTEGIEAEMVEIEKEIETLQESALKDLNELRSLYLFKILESIPGTEYFESNGSRIEINETNNEDFFAVLEKGNVHSVRKTNYGGKQINPVDFHSIEKVVSDQTYKDRVDIVRYKMEGKEKTLLKLKEGLQKRLKVISRLKLQELGLKVSDAHFEGLKESPVLIYLIRNGYIDEDYTRYISFVYQGRLTKNDEDYLKCIKDSSRLGYNHPIDNVNIVVNERLYLKEFSQDEVLNIILVDYLFKTPTNYQLQIESILNLLTKKGEATFPFIEQYLEHGKQQANFFNSLCLHWPEFWSFIEFEIEISEDLVAKFFVCFLKHLKPEAIQSINVSSVFADYIANKTNLAELLLKNDLNKNALRIIKALEIKLNGISDSENQEFEYYIYNHNHYKIFYENLVYFLNRNEPHTNDGIIEPNYSNIKAQSDTKMFEFISQHLNDYLQNVFLLHDDLTDEEEIFVELLNHKGVDRKIKSQIINKKEFKVWDVNTIEDISVIDELLEYGRIEADWENMISMFNLKDEKLDEYLVGFLNRKEVYIELSTSPCKLVDESEEILVDEQDNKIDDNIDSETDEEEVEETKNIVAEMLSEALILNKSLSIEAYKSLMRSIEYEYNDLDISALDIEKRKVLVSNKILALSKENLIWLTENEQLYLKLVSDNKDLFAKEYTILQIPIGKIELILTKVSFNPEQQKSFLKQFNFALITSASLANRICKMCLGCKYPLSRDQIYSILKNCDVLHDKVSIIIDFIKKNRLTSSDASALLKLLGGEYSKLIISSKQPKFSSDEYNKELMEALKQKMHISSYRYKNKTIYVHNFKKP